MPNAPVTSSGTHFNIAEHFFTTARDNGWGNRPLHVCGPDRLTFAELDERSRRAAHVIAGLGLQPEQRVALALADGLDFPVWFWGAIRAGAVPIPLNTQLPADTVRGMLTDSRARWLIADSERARALTPAWRGLRFLRGVGVAGGGADGPAGDTPELVDLDTALASAPAAPATVWMTPDDPAFWLYTSGSTGSPKAAVHLHHDMLYPARHFAADFLGLRPGDITFSASKLFFAYGLGNSLYFPLATGSCSILMAERPDPRKVLGILAEYRPTVLYAVPTLYNALLNQWARWRAGQDDPPHLPADLGHLRLAVSAGEALPGETARRWLETFGCEILDGIGSTEMLQTFLSNPPGAARAGSTGVVVPGYEAKVADDSGQELPAGDAGELWARGASSAPYYWNRSDATRCTMIGDWIRTGDRFRKDVDGYFWYEGRADDMLKVSGQWVSPGEVENVLLGHPAVAECAVVGGANSDGLLRARAHVVPGPDVTVGEALARDLIAHAAATLPRFKQPERIVFEEELPKTATGKVRRFLLRD